MKCIYNGDSRTLSGLIAIRYQHPWRLIDTKFRHPWQWESVNYHPVLSRSLLLGYLPHAPSKQ